MRILAWNCRGLGGPSTVSQLKESLRDFKPGIVFLSETKRKQGFVGSVCKKLGWKDRWYAVDPIGRSASLMVGWSVDVTVHQVISSRFSIEMEVETADTNGKLWVIFVYASNKERERIDQWNELWLKKNTWGTRWLLGGDFNAIRTPQEKKGGRVRTVASCKGFQDFIAKMQMEEVDYQGQQWTWANNWQDEGYIEARLDRFFGAAQWLLENGKARVQHIDKQASDHCMLLLDTCPAKGKKKSRFYFDKRWLTKPGLEEVIRDAWEHEAFGSPMHIVAHKIKQCRLKIMEWNRVSKHNSAKRIEEIKSEMEDLRAEGGARNWGRWQELKYALDEAYKEEEMYWSQKARSQWLVEGDRNTQFFHASVLQRRQQNRLTKLDKEDGGTCSNEEDVVGEVAQYYTDLFQSADTMGWEKFFLFVKKIDTVE